MFYGRLTHSFTANTKVASAIARLICVQWLLCFSSFVFAADGPAADAVAATGVVDMVVASLDGDPITLSELRRFVENTGEHAPDQLLKEHSYALKALRELLLGKMLEKEAAAQNISVSDEDVQEYVGEIKRQNGVDEAGFAEILRQKGLTEEIYRTQVRTDILRSRVVHKLMRSKITVSSDDVNRYFEDHPDRKPVAGTSRVHQFGVTLGDGASDAERTRAREQLEAIVGRLKAGNVPQAMAEESHRDLGYVKIEELRPEFAKALNGLAVGMPSDIVDVGSGLYVFYVASYVTEEGTVDEALREEIKTELVQKQYGTALDKFLNDELPKKYTIELKI